MTAYAELESPVVLAVEFHMNPVNNYTVYWSMGGLQLEHGDVRNNVKGKQVETTYFIANVTKGQVGNYSVRVINLAIASGHNEVTFIVILKLRGKKSNAKSSY